MVVLHESVTEEIETVTNTATPTDSDNDNTNVYSKIGITKNDLAIGIDPEEVLEWIGTWVCWLFFGEETKSFLLIRQSW